MANLNRFAPAAPYVLALGGAAFASILAGSGVDNYFDNNQLATAVLGVGTVAGAVGGMVLAHTRSDDFRILSQLIAIVGAVIPVIGVSMFLTSMSPLLGWCFGGSSVVFSLAMLATDKPNKE